MTYNVSQTNLYHKIILYHELQSLKLYVTYVYICDPKLCVTYVYICDLKLYVTYV